MRESYESKDEAKERTSKEKEKIAAGKKKGNNQGNIHTYDWNWRKCFDYFNTLQYGSEVNYKASAESFGLKDRKGKPLGNGGQLLKKFLEQNGINTSKFKSVRGEVKIAGRRQKIRLVVYIQNAQGI